MASSVYNKINGDIIIPKYIHSLVFQFLWERNSIGVSVVGKRIMFDAVT